MRFQRGSFFVSVLGPLSVLAAVSCGPTVSTPPPTTASATPTASTSPSPAPSGTASASPTPTSSPTASPPGVLSVNPSSLGVYGTGAANAQTLLVQETGYSGSFSESDTCAGIATLAPGNGPGPSLSETVTGVGAGQCLATFSDTFTQVQHATITVTTGGFTIQSRGRQQ